MALRHDANMDSNFLTADPPPIGDMDYQPRTDLASEYFNTFNQICETYRPTDSDVNLRQTSDTLRLSSEILDGVRSEFITTDFCNEKREYEVERFLSGKEEQIFQFGQPDASALLRHRARRRFNEEHGLPPATTSQESGVSSNFYLTHFFFTECLFYRCVRCSNFKYFESTVYVYESSSALLFANTRLP